MSEKVKGYKNVTLYDASQKKNIAISLRRSLFESDEKLTEHIRKLQKEQREKNRLTRLDIKRKQFEDFNKKLSEDMKNAATICIEPEMSIEKYVDVSDKFKLKLDKKTGNTCCIIGSSKQGKSTLLMKIYDDEYSDDKKFISTLFTINPQIGLYKHHKNLLLSGCFNAKSEKYIKLQKYINTKTKNEYKFLNMFDDVIDMKHTKLINELILTYRNSNISSIISLQYGYLISKMNRANVNNVIIFKSNSNEAIQDVINVYLKPYLVKMGFKTFEDQMKIYKHVTDNHGFFYIHPASDTITFHRLKL